MPDRHHDACGVGFVADASGTASRTVVLAALEGLANVRHRGAVAADARTSDGTGLLTPIPAAVYGEGVGVCQLFCPPGGAEHRGPVTEALAAEGLDVVEWRTPPTDDGVLGDLALATRPVLDQALFVPATDGAPHDPEVAAARARRRLRTSAPHVYVASCSTRSIVHKGLVAAESLADFWLDLADDRFATHHAVFHQRFSTNTAPTWERSQPFRALAHNGEVNTLWANTHRMLGRGELGTVAAGLGAESDWAPLLDPDDSDSGQLDEVLSLLVAAGRTVPHAVAMLIPAAWEEDRELDPEVRGFYRYHSALLEPWDGPAGIVVSDGRTVGAALDRNGLRPLRVAICEDGLVVCCSEAGAVDLTGHGSVERTRLGPGQQLVVDPERGLRRDDEVRGDLASGAPYATWAADGFLALAEGPLVGDVSDDLPTRQVAHGCTTEDLAMVLRPMAAEGKEPTFSMGDDAPAPSLAGRPRPIADHLRQRFAQVTNPAIDPLRERLVMSTRTLVGPRRPLLSEGPGAAHLLESPTFLVTPDGVRRLGDATTNPFGVATVDCTFEVADGAAGLERAVDALALQAGELARRSVDGVAGAPALIVLDVEQLSPTRAPVPSLLALGACHQHLVAVGHRERVSLVSVADDVVDVHGVAALLAFGADLVCPRLALETVAADADAADDAPLVSPEAQEHLLAALDGGVRKVLSKMGIATVSSYRGSQLFEVLGLSPEVSRRCFGDAPNAVGGLGWRHLGEDVLARHHRAFPEQRWPDEAPALESPGVIRVRRGGEPHGKSKEVVAALNELTLTAAPPRGTDPPSAADRDVAAAHVLQRAIAGDRYDDYEAFAALVDERAPIELVDLLEPIPSATPVPLHEVEPAEAIVRRFTTGAMSHGALSREAHETLARAMNLLGARSNCGEGGEDPERYRTRGLGRDDRSSHIKQVASGRFGVTPEYLAFADEIQIKISQGSKPGEGGQLPGHKVTAEIARLRHTQPGVGLISPPPHHDIYSIEDLAQLIYDLKQVNGAQVSVKLVACHGVGTIAAGVVKALADAVHISGANGGTGASPLSSIKHAGMPWELGLVEAQRTLVDSGLRDRARLGVDGGMMTGRQVLRAVLLGADDVSFGTAVMIAEGCIMLRACHRDTCKPGIATQRPHLRRAFAGTPEGVAAYLRFVAEHVRRELAAIGARTVDEVIGRSDLLRQRRVDDERCDALDLSHLVRPAGGDGTARRFVARTALQDPRDELGDRLLAEGFRPVWEGDQVEVTHDISTSSRAVGAALSGALALEHGARPPRGRLTAHLRGAAGQSLGAFLAHGVHLDLAGEANDGVGKGMAGGRIVVRPPTGTDAPPDVVGPTPVLVGNTCLYGATGGELFVAGAAGERFAVRASGAVAVVEAVGDHCAEYLTGGTVVVLGSIGRNLGAGMTGGQVFVWHEAFEHLLSRVNPDLVDVRRPDRDAEDEVRWLVERHVELTASPRAVRLLDSWAEARGALWHVVPRSRAEGPAAVRTRRVSAA